MMKIKFIGNEHTNYSSRKGYAPLVIVDHITQGSKESCISWFTSPNNKQSSAHFLVAKDGEIYQFVHIEDMAWSNGLKREDFSRSKVSIVYEKNINPNLYSVSIEHEGVYEETKGKLTEEQLKSTIWLHEYIIDYVKEKFNVNIPADRNHILGHFEIDPIRKPFCPGELYPFKEIIRALNLPFNDIKGYWAKDSILKLYEKGIIEGYPDGSFKPYHFITRGEMAEVINRLIDLL